MDISPFTTIGLLFTCVGLIFTVASRGKSERLAWTGAAICVVGVALNIVGLVSVLA